MHACMHAWICSYRPASNIFLDLYICIFCILGAFAKLLSSSCLSVSMEQLGFHVTDFYEI